MPKNTCSGMTSPKAIYTALGISKSTYYDYIAMEDYPLNAELVEQKAWVDARRDATGASDQQKRKSNVPEEKRDPSKNWEERKARADALAAEQKLDDQIARTIAAAEVYMVQRMQRILDRLGEVLQEELCDHCSQIVHAAYQKAVREIDEYEEELCGDE